MAVAYEDPAARFNARDGDLTPRADGCGLGAPPADETVHLLTAAIAAAGLDDAAEGIVDDATLHADADPRTDETTGEEHPLVLEPWLECTPPSEVGGYVYYKGRHILRVQDNKPDNSCTINCYFHSGCKLLIRMRRKPSNAVLAKWAFMVPPQTDGMDRVEKARLRDEHQTKGKALCHSACEIERQEQAIDRGVASNR